VDEQADNQPQPGRKPRWLLLLIGVGLMLGGVWLRSKILESTAADPQRPSGGGLILCGGGELPPVVREQFLEWAGGPAARIVVIPSFDEPSAEDLRRVASTWAPAGAVWVKVLHARSREEADAPGCADVLREATAVWLSGGDQAWLARTYVDTAVEREIKGVLDRGGVVGGTSAGAAAMSRMMIRSAGREVEEKQGFDLFPGVIVDQHLLQRNRLQRLLRIQGAHPELMGVGIDESTALLVERNDGRLRVIGQSYVVLCLPATEQREASIQIMKRGDQALLKELRTADPQRAIVPREWMEHVLSN